MSAQWLVAGVAGMQVAIPLKDVREIVETGGVVTLLPRLPSTVAGVIEMSGCAIPLIDLGALYADSPRHDRRNAVIANAGFATLALLVDGVEGILNAEELGEDVRRIDPRNVLETLD